jgi:hypothetical protein
LIIGALSDLTRSHTDLVVENALLRQQLIVLNRQIKRPLLTNPVILKNKLSSPWTVKRNHLAKFQPKTPKNLTDEASSQWLYPNYSRPSTLCCACYNFNHRGNFSE